MGNTASSKLAWEEAGKVKQAISRKCDCYVVSIEHTNALVDVKLTSLRKEITDLVDPLRSTPCVQELGLLGMSSVLEDVENFANEHKFIIKRMLDIMFETQTAFEEVTQRHLDVASAEEALDEDMLDEDCMAEMRSSIEDIVLSYETELHDMGIPLYFKTKRSDELRRLLFKLAESTISDGVESFVLELKETVLQEIDNDLVQGMITGDFNDAAKVRESLKQIITDSEIALASLEALPFSRRVDIECAQDEIAQHVEQLVRRIQMHHAHSLEDLTALMTIDRLYDNSSDEEEEEDGEDSSKESSSDQNDEEDDEEEEDEEEDEEEEVVVSVPVSAKKGRKSSAAVAAPSTAQKGTKRKSPSTAKKEQSATATKKARKSPAAPKRKSSASNKKSPVAAATRSRKAPKKLLD
jgi:hypothetical protein